MRWWVCTLICLTLQGAPRQSALDEVAVANLMDKAGKHLQAAREILRIRHRESGDAEKKHGEYRRWMEEGLVSRQEFQQVASALQDARQAVVRQKTLCATLESLLAELDKDNTLSRAEGVEQPGAPWNLEWFPHLLNHFWRRFDRELPISALGQTSTHNEMGLDHRQRVDVALHPSSPEGKAVILYLREKGYPFTAFRSSVPGAATGAHIHIGPGSLQLLP